MRPAATDSRGKRFTAYRSDVFDLLLSREGLTDVQHRAARRPQGDVAARAGLSRAEPGLTLVDDGGSPFKSGVAARMIEAGERVDGVLRLCGHRFAVLLRALVESQVLQEVRPWRDLVQAASGETDPAAQAALVRFACADLAAAYQAWDARPGHRSAA